MSSITIKFSAIIPYFSAAAPFLNPFSKNIEVVSVLFAFGLVYNILDNKVRVISSLIP